MTHFCDLCGDPFESGRLFVAAQASACNDCITNLIDNEAEKRGLAAESKAFALYWGGFPDSSDRERQDLKDAGRGHLNRG